SLLLYTVRIPVFAVYGSEPAARRCHRLLLSRPINPLVSPAAGVNDWPLLDAPQPNANIIARAKGLHIQASQEGGGWFSPFSMVFQEQDSRFNRSTLQVNGMIGPEATGEWAIVGGTGKLAMARGIIKYKFPQIVTSVENYRQLDIHAFYTPQAV
uniref:Dirigent protein n=2 Tax=Triticinae TaxID=1648030 RepID=A0A453ADI7_AEGTS